MIFSTLLSLMWHVFIVVIFVIGIPFLQRDIGDAEPLVFVTLVNEVPETNQPVPSAKATTQSEEIEVASRIPPAPSKASAPSSPTLTKQSKEAAVDFSDLKQEEILQLPEEPATQKSEIKSSKKNTR